MRRSLVISLVAVVAALCVGLTTASAAPGAEVRIGWTPTPQWSRPPRYRDRPAGHRRERPATGRERHRARHGPRPGPGRPASGPGSRPEADPGQGGLTVQEFAAEQAANGFNVWRSYDEPGGIRDQLYAARAKPPAGEARGPRPHRPGSRDHRGQADPGRSRATGRQASGRPLQLHPARA